MIEFTRDEAAEQVAFWQRVLRLQDWDVEVQIVRRHELHVASALASTTITTYRRALIKIGDPTDFTKDDWPIERDLHASLVHELVHLHLHDLRVTERDAQGRDTAEWIALERATESIARALLALYHEARPA